MNNEICGPHRGEDADGGLLGCHTVSACRLVPMFRRKILPPSTDLTQTARSLIKFNATITSCLLTELLEDR
jgi:hypothetical protein